MNYYNQNLTESQKMYIRREVRFRLLSENLLNEEASIFDNFMSKVSGKLAGLTVDASGNKNATGKLLDKLIPDTFATTLKKKLLQSLAKSMGIDDNQPLIEFTENIVANIELSEITAIISGKVKCEQIVDILLRGATQSLTKLGLKKLAVPIVHFFAEHNFDKSAPNFIKKKNKMKSVTERDVTAMLDTMIGVLGETLISKIVYAFIKEHAVPFMSNHICKALGILEEKGRQMSGEDNAEESVSDYLRRNNPDASDEEIRAAADEVDPPPALEENNRFNISLKESYRIKSYYRMYVL